MYRGPYTSRTTSLATLGHLLGDPTRKVAAVSTLGRTLFSTDLFFFFSLDELVIPLYFHAAKLCYSSPESLSSVRPACSVAKKAKPRDGASHPLPVYRAQRGDLRTSRVISDRRSFGMQQVWKTTGQKVVLIRNDSPGNLNLSG